MVASPELRVTVVELRDLKHNGGHSVEVGFHGPSSRSPFIDGYGAFKAAHFTSIFPLTNSQALSKDFWSTSSVYIAVSHQRLITSDKIVGECAIPIASAREGEMTGWFPLKYKGTNRGFVKLEIYTKNVPRPALSATNSPQPIGSPHSRHQPRSEDDKIREETLIRHTPQVSSAWPS